MKSRIAIIWLSLLVLAGSAHANATRRVISEWDHGNGVRLALEVSTTHFGQRVKATTLTAKGVAKNGARLEATRHFIQEGKGKPFLKFESKRGSNFSRVEASEEPTTYDHIDLKKHISELTTVLHGLGHPSSR